MKRLIIALALLISSSVVSAEEAAQAPDHCSEMGGLAKSIMNARQAGAAMSEVLQVVKEKMPAAAEVLRPFVIMAYEETQWSSEDRREDAANRFRNKIELACYKNG